MRRSFGIAVTFRRVGKDRRRRTRTRIKAIGARRGRGFPVPPRVLRPHSLTRRRDARTRPHVQYFDLIPIRILPRSPRWQALFVALFARRIKLKWTAMKDRREQ